MGIAGLLPFLKDIHRSVHLSNFKGKTIAVDSYVWLHRGAFACALELGTGQHTTKYVGYCMRMVDLLLSNDITPIMVFDGGVLPMKAPTERSRHRRREENKRKAHQLLQAGQKTKALECFQSSVDVTPHMAAALIKVLRARNIQCIVAPYEADAQIAYLLQQSLADAAISEDSDLLVFGCAVVLFKLEKEGDAVQICLDDFGAVKGMETWTHRRFRQMCIMSGCDYLESPSGIGLKKAHVMLKYKYAEEVMRNWKWGRAVNAPKCPDGYAEMFRMAELTFMHQRVYDPRTEQLVHLSPLPADLLEQAPMMEFLGPDVSPEQAKGVADGFLHPVTKRPLDGDSDRDADKENAISASAPPPPPRPAIWKPPSEPLSQLRRSHSAPMAKNYTRVLGNARPRVAQQPQTSKATTPLISQFFTAPSAMAAHDSQSSDASEQQACDAAVQKDSKSLPASPNSDCDLACAPRKRSFELAMPLRDNTNADEDSPLAAFRARAAEDVQSSVRSRSAITKVAPTAATPDRQRKRIKPLTVSNSAPAVLSPPAASLPAFKPPQAAEPKLATSVFAKGSVARGIGASLAAEPQRDEDVENSAPSSVPLTKPFPSLEQFRFSAESAAAGVERSTWSVSLTSSSSWFPRRPAARPLLTLPKRKD
ncbi:Rad2 nuclease [Geranomyces variabilis]|uniref:Exonuclease 1 n=1 Tax=Geranomyces variabilis TaxID=109894 RepID=A0AAD5TN45_9FUNG|nr:Rad2 nuclease [Geranomyces variabilis]